MYNLFRDCLWKNFAAAIDMLKNAIAKCPDEVWQKEKKFFYIAYHTSIFLDYYSTYPVKDFQPGLPYTITDEDKLPADAIDDVIPDRFYSKQELLTWLSSAREKCKQLVTILPEQKLHERWITDAEVSMHVLCAGVVESYSVLEILFHNLRHVQHHVGQLNFMLRQTADIGAGWIAQAD